MSAADKAKNTAQHTEGKVKDDIGEKISTSSGESLEELQEQTDEVMADARKEVARARETLHDQLLPSAQSVEEEDRT